MRIIVAAIAGGIVVFVWGAISHMVLPLGTMGLRPLPAEEVVVPGLRIAVKDPGLYFFPGRDLRREHSDEEEKAYAERHRTGPAGLLLYRPVGGEVMSPLQLLTELLSNVIAAGLAALVLAGIPRAYPIRVLAAASFGVVGWLSISVSHWNWYRFPDEFIAAEGMDQAASWLLSGLVMAAIVRPRTKATVA